MDIQEYIASGAIEACVLGVADEADMAELQRLRHAYPEVAAAVLAAERWLLDYAEAHAVPVSEDVRVKALARLDGGGSVVVSARKAGRFYPYLAAASLLVAVVCVALLWQNHRRYTAIAEDYAIVSGAHVVRVQLPGVTGKENNLVTVYWDTLSKAVYLRTDRLPAAPAGRQYQLWALVDGKPVDAGVLENCSGLCRLKPVIKAQAFAITLEPAGGSPTPTLSQMCVLGKVAS